MRMPRHLTPLFFLVLLFAGCATREPAVVHVSGTILPFLSQAPAPLEASRQKRLYADFLSHRYAPWQMDALDATYEQATWPVSYYASKEIYAENRRPMPKARFRHWVENADYGAYNTLKRHALVIHPSALRLFPTRRPLFYDPSRPGEGYPFDYNQNSAIKAMTPVIVSHLSRDGGWAFVQSPFALGWVPIRDIAFVGTETKERLMAAPHVVLLREYAPLYDARQSFLFNAKMATLFPETGREPSFFHVLVPKGCDGNLRLETSLLPDAWSESMPLPMNAQNIRRVAEELLGEPYGWGGMAEDRDCSAMTRDFFAPFAIWLPRNSKAQAQVGRVIDLHGLPADEKERALIENGVPFRTLLYLPGHIMLYIGHKEGRAYALHNIWGIRTKNGGRILIGRAVVTDLWVGRNIPEADKKALLIERIESMNIVTEQ